MFASVLCSISLRAHFLFFSSSSFFSSSHETRAALFTSFPLLKTNKFVDNKIIGHFDRDFLFPTLTQKFAFIF